MFYVLASVITMFFLQDLPPAIVTFLDFLSWVLTPGAGVLAFFLLEKVKQLAAIVDPTVKRCVAFALSAGIAIAAYLLMVAMQYRPAPVDIRAWVEALFAVGAVAGGIATLIHGFTLKPK